MLSRKDFFKLTGVVVGIGLGGGEFVKKFQESVNLAELVFAFEYHKNPDSLRIQEEMFQHCDAMVIETGPWNDEISEEVKDISNGNMAPDSAYRNDRRMNMLLGSKKPVYFLDPPDTWGGYNTYYDEILPRKEVNLDMSLNEQLLTFRNTLVSEAKLHYEREQYWEARLEDAIQDMLQRRGKYDFSRPKLLITAGHYHTRIYHSIKKQWGSLTGDIIAERSLGTSKTHVQSFDNEMMRRYIYLGEEPNIDLLLRFTSQKLLERYCGDMLPDFGDDARGYTIYVRKLVNSIPVGNIPDIFTQIAENERLGKSEDASADYLRNIYQLESSRGDRERLIYKI